METQGGYGFHVDHLIGWNSMLTPYLGANTGSQSSEYNTGLRFRGGHETKMTIDLKTHRTMSSHISHGMALEMRYDLLEDTLSTGVDIQYTFSNDQNIHENKALITIDLQF